MKSEIVNKVINLKSQGNTMEDISLILGLSISTIIKILDAPLVRKILKEKQRDKIKKKRISKIKKERKKLLKKKLLDYKFDIICLNNHQLVRKGKNIQNKYVFKDSKCHKKIKFYLKLDQDNSNWQNIFECCYSPMKMLNSARNDIYNCPLCKFKIKIYDKTL